MPYGVVQIVSRTGRFQTSAGRPCTRSGPLATDTPPKDHVRQSPDIAAAGAYTHPMDLDPERCYRAALSKDSRFDGRFFTGVVTTGIYCRPVCPVVPPKFKNMRFYACAAAAEAAGFRPCKRCRPETAPGTPAWEGTSAVVSRALRLIAEGGLDDGNIEAFSARLGLGERQVRRLFAQHLGAAPFDVLRARRVHFARRLLDDTVLPITQVAHAAGFASIRQFNHAMKATFAQPPTQLRRATHKNSTEATERGGLRVRLLFRPPLAWNAMLKFLSYRAIPGVEAIENGRYRRTFDISPDNTGTVEIYAGLGLADPDDPATSRNGKTRAPHHTPHLWMHVDGPQGRDLLGLVERARRLFDLGADPAPIAEHLSRSPALAARVAAMPGLRVPGAWDGFELAVRAILGQQVTVQGATTLAGRVVERFGTPLATPSGALTHRFPHASVLAEANLSTIGLPRARAAALRNMATAVASGVFRFDAALGLDEAVERLCAIPGIGPWTANYIAMRALAEPDAFPESDLGLRHALGHDSAPASVAEVREHAEHWRPWRSYAALYLWAVPFPSSQALENAS